MASCGQLPVRRLVALRPPVLADGLGDLPALWLVANVAVGELRGYR
jgi:hypothetical protein